jgi:hypothetical protein
LKKQRSSLDRRGVTMLVDYVPQKITALSVDTEGRVLVAAPEMHMGIEDELCCKSSS